MTAGRTGCSPTSTGGCSTPRSRPTCWRRQAVEQRAVRRLAIEVLALDDESIARIEALADMESCRTVLAAALERMGSGERHAVRLRVVEEMRYVAVLTTGDSTPVETCRRVMHISGPISACAGPAVVVFPGGRGTCEKLGLTPLPAAYVTARRKVDRLADCWAPRDLARRVQTLLDGLPGWRGWHTKLDLSMGEGPCGTVSHLQDDGTRSADGYGIVVMIRE
jgi:hypothetical protein